MTETRFARAWGTFLCVIALAVWQHWTLPEIRRADADILDGFSAERAREVIQDLSACGFKYIGSHANEVCAVEALRRHINDAARSHEDRIQVGHQSASGHFYLGTRFMDGFTSVYKNLTNVVVHVNSSRAPSCTLLISSHFDSTFGSPAAADSNAEIAIMVEMLRLLLHNPELQSKPVDVIFNFNGGEEMLLQAAHGFITSHPWSKNICAFINLESMGSGGRELLFQVGKNRWIVDAYKQHAERPFAQSLIQTLFETGLLPGDTDYRIYRDFGDLPGADFAIISNDYVYHTTRDDLEHVDFRTVQRYGESAFGLAFGMIDFLEHGPPSADETTEAAVFFDIAGRFLVCYSADSAIIINLFVVALSLCCIFLLASSFSNSKLKAACSLLWTDLKSLLRCWLCAFFSTVIIAGSLSLLQSFTPVASFAPALVGSGHPELIPLLYTTPTVLGFLGGRCPNKDTRDPELIASTTALASILLATVCLILCLGFCMLHPDVIATSYFFLAWILPVIGEVIHFWTRKRWSVVSDILLIGFYVPPWLITAQIWILAIDVLCPMTMRSGTGLPGDVLLASLHAFLVGACLAFSCRFYANASWKDIGLRSPLITVLVVGICLSCIHFPYSYDRPKRIYMQHVARSKIQWDFTGSSSVRSGELPMDSGIWTVAMDWNGVSTLQEYAPLTFPSNSVPPDESLGVYGELPSPFPIKDLVAKGLWAVTVPPELPSKLTLDISLHEQDGYCGNGAVGSQNAVCQRAKANVDGAVTSPSLRIMHFSVSGGSHVRIAIARRPYIKSWSLGYIAKNSDTDKLDSLPPPRLDCDCYWVLFSEGGQEPTRGRSEAFNFSITIEVGDEDRDLRLDIWDTHLEAMSPEIKNYTARAPHWMNFVGWVAEVQVHEMRVPASGALVQ